VFTATDNSGWYVLVAFDGVYLLIPQAAVQSIEIIADLYVAQTPIGAVGWFEQEHGQGQSAPVFCLGRDLHLLLDIPKTRQYLILLKAPQLPVGITCDEAENINLKREHFYLQTLPPVMSTPQMPISQLLVYKEKIGCVCTGDALIEHLAEQSERFTQTETAQKISSPRRRRVINNH
jgi:hypothetical protein